MTSPTAAVPSERDIGQVLARLHPGMFEADHSVTYCPNARALTTARSVLALFAPILAEKERTALRRETRALSQAQEWRNIAEKSEARALAAEAALAAAVEALAPFADEKNGAMQDILWGDQPDSATMTITCHLGQVRKAREAVRAAAIRAQIAAPGAAMEAT